jgi:PTS system nitrogen regulatory IIA component
MDFMDFGTLLAPEAVVLDMTATSQKQVFERVGALLADVGETPAETIVGALAERERQGTTGFGDGTAIPHGRVIGYPRLAAAVVRLAHPVDWNAVDGLPVDLVLALAGPELAGADNLKALALLSRTLRDRELVAKMRGANDAGALWSLLAGQARQAA